MLYKSTQTVVEKRPVDEVTGEAKNTLSEDNFLREKIDYHTMVGKTLEWVKEKIFTILVVTHRIIKNVF